MDSLYPSSFIIAPDVTKENRGYDFLSKPVSFFREPGSRRFVLSDESQCYIAFSTAEPLHGQAVLFAHARLWTDLCAFSWWLSFFLSTYVIRFSSGTLRLRCFLLILAPVFPRAKKDPVVNNRVSLMIHCFLYPGYALRRFRAPLLYRHQSSALILRSDPLHSSCLHYSIRCRRRKAQSTHFFYSLRKVFSITVSEDVVPFSWSHHIRTDRTETVIAFRLFPFASCSAFHFSSHTCKSSAPLMEKRRNQTHSCARSSALPLGTAFTHTKSPASINRAYSLFRCCILYSSSTELTPSRTFLI